MLVRGITKSRFWFPCKDEDSGLRIEEQDLFELREYITKKPLEKISNGFFVFSGDSPGTRTRDTLIKSQVLYRLS